MCKNIQYDKNGKNHAPHAIHGGEGHVDPRKIGGSDKQVFIDQDSAEDHSSCPVKHVKVPNISSGNSQQNGNEVKKSRNDQGIAVSEGFGDGA